MIDSIDWYHKTSPMRPQGCGRNAQGARLETLIFNYFGVRQMTLFKCTLIKNGYIQERFYREGDSESEMLESLTMFNWGDGNWEIVEVSA